METDREKADALWIKYKGICQEITRLEKELSELDLLAEYTYDEMMALEEKIFIEDRQNSIAFIKEMPSDPTPAP